MRYSQPYTARLTFGPEQREAEIGWLIDITPDSPFTFESGESVDTLTMAYQTYGTLNAEASNAILVNHGLTGDQYMVGPHPVTGKPGWWEKLVGPGQIFDTDRYFIIASNVLGGCMGSLGPRSINPTTGIPYGLEFPVITIGDMVRAQVLLIEALGISKLLSVVGGSMGGMLALEWAAHHAEKVSSVVAIATAARHSPQNIAFHEIGRQAIMADPNWHGGAYLREGTFPAKGLAVARMTAHVTYLSENALQKKFGRKLQIAQGASAPRHPRESSDLSISAKIPACAEMTKEEQGISYSFDADFQVESYLRHQGKTFVERFDPNSYLTITRAMDYFDLEADAGGHLSSVFAGRDVRACVISFSSDWLFPTAESRRVVRALAVAGLPVSFTEIASDKGHDAFLLEEPVFFDTLHGFLDGVAKESSGAKRPRSEGGAGRRDAPRKQLRPDLQAIADLVPDGARVLDVGCGDGELLAWLATYKQVEARGIELATENVNKAIAAGVPVIQGDIETDLILYPEHMFDVVILSQTLQAMRDPQKVLAELMRVGKTAIVSVPNFGHWKNRLYLATRGRMPVTQTLSYEWYDTPNIHFCTLSDFVVLCERMDIKVAGRLWVDALGQPSRFTGRGFFANLFGEQGVFLLTRDNLG